MASPLPLVTHPLSGAMAQIPWAFEGNFNLQLGHDGVAWTEVMQINWADLQAAVTALLGYSWRDESTVGTLGVSQLRRKLPWQHPYFTQLWVKNITDVRGMRMLGSNQVNDVDDFIVAVAAAGNNVPLNLGPWTEFERAKITVQFWRPPYFVRSDESIQDDDGIQQEWLRYVDKKWTHSAQVLTREGSMFTWSGGTGPGGPAPRPTGLPGSVGQIVTHERVSRTWYEVPEAGIFQTAQDGTPNGQAYNLLYSQLDVYNPITGYSYSGGYPMPGSVNVPIGGGDYTLSCTTTNNSAVVTTAVTTGINIGDSVTGPGIPTASYVLSINPGVSFTMNWAATTSATNDLIFVSDYDSTLRLFGALMGTLRYDLAEVNMRPLQLPPYLMQIPYFSQGEAVSQQQCDVTLHFDIFDPPRGSNVGHRGHNLLPWSGNGLWYPANSNKSFSGTTSRPFLTAHPYADLSKLFQIL